MMRGIGVDTWAFVEVAMDRPRRAEVTSVFEDAHALATTRDVIAETFNYLTYRTGRAEVAWDWWESLRLGQVRVVEQSLEALHTFMASRAQMGGLSLADHSLGAACMAAGIMEVATADRAFEAFGLIPLFAT